MKVKSVIFNWFQCGSVVDRDGSGEDFSKYIVGGMATNLTVISIDESIPRNVGEVWNYLIHFDDGSSARIFNPNHVEYFPDEEIRPEFPKDRKDV